MIIILIIFLLVLACFGVAAISAAPWVPARRADIDALLEDMRLSKGKTYVELGSGDGRLLLAVSQTGAQVIGYEINPLFWLISLLRTARRPNIRVHLKNFWRIDLSRADVVLAFLIPRTMPRLETKLAAEMKHGSKFISYVFPLPHTKPVKQGASWFVYQISTSQKPENQ